MLPRSISTVLALRSVPAEAPLPGWVDISITLSLEMASELCELRCKKIAHAHQVVTGESQQRRELRAVPTFSEENQLVGVAG